eukprot:TRINITY_DN16465_c1_g1_i8.p5 TRINITY_DN16465_c1_g1~~TRINITY_DN16465_c1_g1_i8.p5  ORF type:complete len:195 (-),score=28.34 TRINITY_DN16465_c1_g1_i8:666-1250(-)
MTMGDKYAKAYYIPGWFYGPEKKLWDLKASGLFYKNRPKTMDEEELYEDEFEQEDEDIVDEEYVVNHPLVRTVRQQNMIPSHAEGFHVHHKRMQNDGTWDLMAVMAGFQGTPPMVYGVSWNPQKPQDGRRGSEFLSYGVKHLKTWIVDQEGRWIGKAASFGTTRVDNVVSAIYVPAKHSRRAPGDSCILSGFPM